jgi:phosphoribosyl-AMP cyclohydrolase
MSAVGWDALAFAKHNGLLPVIVQDAASRKLLMTAFANRQAVERTVRTGYAHYWSRSRATLWKKGETSGHVQHVREIRVDCDSDALLYLVEQVGPACHTGRPSCFFQDFAPYRPQAARQERAMLQRVVQLFEEARVIRVPWRRDMSRRSYTFFSNPVTEAVPPVTPDVLEWIAAQIDAVTPDDIDKVVVPEALGVPFATLVASRKKRPLAIVRKHSFHTSVALLGRVRYASGYETGTYYVYGVQPQERVLIVDDTISTGGTLVALLRLFQRRQVRVADVVCVMEKPMYGGREVVRRTTGVDVKTLFRVTRPRQKVRATPTWWLWQTLAA